MCSVEYETSRDRELTFPPQTVIIATLGQAVAGHGPAISIIGVLVMWRFIMGVGIGGDYPLSAVITSEFAATRIRGRMMTVSLAVLPSIPCPLSSSRHTDHVHLQATFWSQGYGQFAAALVSIVCLKAFEKQLLNDPAGYAQYVLSAARRRLDVGVSTQIGVLTFSLPSPFPQNSHFDFVWRLIIGLGAVPGAFALYFRLTLPETPRFTMDVERNIKQASTDVDAFLATGHPVVDTSPTHEIVVNAPKATFKDFCHHFGQWKNGKILFGCAYSWFALDVAFYGLGLNSSIILSAIGYGTVTTGTAQAIRYHTVRPLFSSFFVLLPLTSPHSAGLQPQCRKHDHRRRWSHPRFLGVRLSSSSFRAFSRIDAFSSHSSFLRIDKWGRKPIQLMGFIVLTITLCWYASVLPSLRNRRN
jgi:PHS family inorganic phosphate transporter-like MFS transporter